MSGVDRAAVPAARVPPIGGNAQPLGDFLEHTCGLDEENVALGVIQQALGGAAEEQPVPARTEVRAHDQQVDAHPPGEIIEAKRSVSDQAVTALAWDLHALHQLVERACMVLT